MRSDFFNHINVANHTVLLAVSYHLEISSQRVTNFQIILFREIQMTFTWCRHEYSNMIQFNTSNCITYITQLREFSYKQQFYLWKETIKRSELSVKQAKYCNE